jgi:hypothetical protein
MPLGNVSVGAGSGNGIGELLARVEMQIRLLTIASELSLQFADAGPLNASRV